ncbi:CGNR zinc finger domain-containing protein [Streptomyces sp. NPDC002669]|uniref:CGNR zinc finger domain-containing protein n=1 Tax=Streptomyces sp. NPDC002669 TaxID=3364658 RepID=UPI0036A3275C
MAIRLASPAVAAAFDGHRAAADSPTSANLLETRAALGVLVDATPPADRARGALNEVLARGRLRRTSAPPRTVTEIDDPSWAPAWAAAVDHLSLLDDRPERLRPCADPARVLHFYDASKNGPRRWCSMAGCGNRAKASRPYARRSGAARALPGRRVSPGRLLIAGPVPRTWGAHPACVDGTAGARAPMVQEAHMSAHPLCHIVLAVDVNVWREMRTSRHGRVRHEV